MGAAMSKPSFAIVGGGWRAAYFLRIARALPERFQVSGVVVRDPVRAQRIEAAWGLTVHPSVQALLRAGRPDFLVVAVSRTSAPVLLAEAAAASMPVLTETPPGPDLAALLDVWKLVAGGAVIQVAEQYPLHPWHAARIALVRSGRLGEISHAQVSVAHDYHGMSLLRLLLGVGFAPARIAARSFTAPLTAGPTRQGPPDRQEIVASIQVIAQLEFGAKLGIHDFASGQYRSWIRSPYLLVRGERGEIRDAEVRYLQDFRTPVMLELRRIDTGLSGGPEPYRHLGILAGDEWLHRNPFPEASLSDDEIAGATLLHKMAEHVAGGPAPYPFAEAAQDQYLALCIEEAIRTGTVVTTETHPWANQALLCGLGMRAEDSSAAERHR
jgi:predicted dehydrogenase